MAELDAPGAEQAEWIVRAERLAPTIDGVEYYRCLRRSLIEARRQVLILGWDFHSEIDLLRGAEAERARRAERWPVRLSDLLEALAEEREELLVRILIWEGASLFALERQHLPRMKLPWTQPRIRLEWDRDTPPLGSKHEKIVVVDDRIAYAGGMDLTKSRWDAHEHRREDERRRNPGLWPSRGAPYHDLMLAVDGQAARVLGEWCRERWCQATGERLEAPPPPRPEDPDAWPAELEPLLRDRALALVRTQPGFQGLEEKRQVEHSYLAQIRAARRLVYIETQYLTHGGVVDELVGRLRDPAGPEVVIVLPHGCEGTLQALALDPPRDALLDRLREADPGGRLFVGWPTLAGGSDEDLRTSSVYVHAKSMVVDDRLLRIGSSNLNRRSMGLDFELDLFTCVDADDAQGMAAVASYRRRSLAYLLGVEPGELADAEERRGSLVAAIGALSDGRQTLHPFDHRARVALDWVDLPLEIADPSHPLGEEDVQRVLRAIELDAGLAEKARKGASVLRATLRRWRWHLLAGALLASLLLAWRLTPLREWAEPEAVAHGIQALRAGPVGSAGVLGGFLLLAAVGFPVTVLIAAVGAAFAPGWSVVLCLAGVAGSSALGHLVGRRLARPSARRAPLGRLRRLGRIGRRFADSGVLALAVLRNIPIAPFAVVNVACGLIGVALGPFLVGTLVGMLPGIVLLAFLGQEIGRWIAQPSLGGSLRLAAIAAAMGAVALAAGALLRRLGLVGDEERGRGEPER